MKFLRLLNRLDEPTGGAIAALADAPEDHSDRTKTAGAVRKIILLGHPKIVLFCS
jgi:hypothetical protein